MVSRRDFIARAGIAATLPPTLLQGCTSSLFRPDSDKLPNSAWQELAEKMRDNGNSNGTVALPSSPSYSALALPRNISYASLRPRGVALCTDNKNVQTAVKWAKEQDIAPVPRSPSAHSYAGYSVTNGLSLDLSAMNRVEVNKEDGTVKIGAGAMLGDVAQALARQGLILPIGRCYSVGVTGLTLAGGFGFNSRRYGMTCDSLIESEMVTANGDVVVCNEQKNSDLFWALRGGNGGTFGVNTSFTFATQQGASTVHVYRLNWTFKIDQKSEIAKVWSALQTAAAKAPNEFSIRIGIDCTPGQYINVEGLGQFYGSHDELMDLLKPALETQPEKRFIQSLDFASAGRYLLAVGAPNAFYTKSAFIDHDFNDGFIDEALDWLYQLPSTAKSGSITMFRWGGAIENKKPEDTAFVHRSGQYVVEGTVRWRPGNRSQVIRDARQWLHEGFEKRLNQAFNGSAFQSFIDREQRNWQQAYYGDNFARLQEIKSRWDAQNTFNNLQSIPPL